jgi:hypothetical protein
MHRVAALVRPLTQERSMKPLACANVAIVAAAIVLASAAPAARAHGIAGSRFFPATLATDDLFVLDELALPTIATIRRGATGEAPTTRETELSFEYAKRITPNFGLSIGRGFSILGPQGARTPASAILSSARNTSSCSIPNAR